MKRDPVRVRMSAVRAKAEARWNDRNVAVVELHGRWTIRSLDERNHPEPYWSGESLEAAEAFVSQPQVAPSSASDDVRK